MQRHRRLEQVADEIGEFGHPSRDHTNPLKSGYFLRWIIPIGRALPLDAVSPRHDGVLWMGYNGITALVVEDESLVRRANNDATVDLISA